MRAQKRKYSSVIISPHLDDAVFSCGGVLASQTFSARHLVINVFSNCGGANPVRKFEEEAAKTFFGYDSVYLEFPDLVVRDRWGRLPHRMHRTLGPKDKALLHRIEGKINLELKDIDFDYLIFPLGVGMHLDHLICFEASQFFWKDPRLFFYEDLPYALAPLLLNLRLAQLHGTEDGLELDVTPLVDYFFSRPGWSWWGRTLLKSSLRRIMKGFLHSRVRQMGRASTTIPGPLRCRPFAIQGYFQNKISGILKYSSQWPIFFHSPADLEELYRKFHYSNEEGSNELIERVWTFSA